MFDEPGSAREEAERLVGVVLAAASMAANAHPGLSTGSAECCVCPLCRVIAAVRDPDPAMVERLTSGAGDLAAGVASFLRNVAAPGSNRDSWHTATRSAAEDSFDPTTAAATGWPDTPTAHASSGMASPRTAAARVSALAGTLSDAAAKARATAAGLVPVPAHAGGAAGESTAGQSDAAKKPMAKKAVAKKAVAPKADTPSAEDRPKKTVAKKAAAKKAPPPEKAG